MGIAIVALCSLYSPITTQAGDEETYFVVTAYYSPLPDQSRYTTWSYYWDIRLNGEWHTTASGKGVFPGILAAPANYPFGTKVYFEGYWIWAVEDRWGAIVKAWERWHSYDRIDIWMGYWDEGLARALTWGTRTIKWKIVVPSAEVSLSFWESPIGTLTKLNVNPENSDSNDVIKLQEIFTKAEIYAWELDWKYKSIESELVEFQLKSWIIQSKNDESAGWYGPKTIAALRKEYGNSTTMLGEEPVEDFATYNHRQASKKYRIILEYWDLQVDPDSDEETIKELQKLLTQLWEYDWSINGSYKSVEDTLVSLQKKIGLISHKDDWGAWYFWNKTKSALWVYYEQENDIFLSNSEQDELTDSEKSTLNKAVLKLKSSYSEELVMALSMQIDTIINKAEYKKYKSKLRYIKDIL